jgi:drug/metabolite transporter (DMT)-like permease
MISISSFLIHRPIRASVYVALAVLAFALSDAITKHLATSYPVSIVVFARYLIGLIILSSLSYPSNGRHLWSTTNTWLVVFRALCLAFASLTLGFALRLMPLAETISIVYLAPFLVMIAAKTFLNERISATGWLSAIFGFIGVIIIVRPDSGLNSFGVALVLINVFFAVAYHILTRLLTSSETTLALLFHTLWIGSVFFGALSIGSNFPISKITIFDTFLFLILGVCAMTGHFLFTSAYRYAPASQLAPVNYLHIVWASGLGWLVFNQIPTTLSSIGIMLIIAAGIIAALYGSPDKR